MRKIIILLLLSLFPFAASAQRERVNYDESKVGPYVLEDPLRFIDGKQVTNASDWAERRHEILELFQSEMYGRMPVAPESLLLETVEEGVTLAGFGTRRQVRMWFKEDKSGPYIDWLIVYPRHAKGPVPSILLLNYYGNHTLLNDKEVLVPEYWMGNDAEYKIVNNRASEASRGSLTTADKRYVYPINMILARGYAFITACYEDVSPDPEVSEQESKSYTDIFELWPPRDPSRKDNTTSLNAWAWALMRGMDMIEMDSLLDPSKVVVTGCSRLGKAALIAGAFDERFPVVVPVQTGGGGVPLAKRNFGETIATEVVSFTHWYCRAYDKYADNETNMPFDQHLFISCVAPRALLVEGFDQPWFDTKGEFLSVQAASPVWKMLDKEGLPDVDWPDDYDTKAIGKYLGYVRRSEEHGISAYDWTWMMNFADKIFYK